MYYFYQGKFNYDVHSLKDNGLVLAKAKEPLPTARVYSREENSYLWQYYVYPDRII